MKSEALVVLVAFALLAPPAALGEERPPEPAGLPAILEEIDAVNRFSDSYTALVRVASYAPLEQPAISTYRMYSKGLRKALLVYLEPPKDAGKKIAMNGESYWFYFPRARQSMLVRPMNTLTGSIAVGDMIGEPVLDLYDFARSEATEEGGIRLTFAAKGSSSPYGKVEYEYREGRIVSQGCYTRSGILLKTIAFLEYAPGGGYATKIKIKNAVYPDYYALIQISELRKMDAIPDFYFTPEGLADAGSPTR